MTDTTVRELYGEINAVSPEHELRDIINDGLKIMTYIGDTYGVVRDVGKRIHTELTEIISSYEQQPSTSSYDENVADSSSYDENVADSSSSDENVADYADKTDVKS